MNEMKFNMCPLSGFLKKCGGLAEDREWLSVCLVHLSVQTTESAFWKLKWERGNMLYPTPPLFLLTLIRNVGCYTEKAHHNLLMASLKRLFFRW